MMRLSCLTLIAAACLVSSLMARQAGASGANDDFVLSLTKENITAFLEEMRTMSAGKNEYLSESDLAGYLNKHLAEKGSFRSKTLYEIPGYPPSETELKVGKAEYIDNIVQGRDMIHDLETSVEIRDIRITGNGKAATLTTVSTEKGKMPWPNGQGTDDLVTIEGRSDCEQRVIVSLTNYIQLTSAECSTTITFLPFGDRPLGE